ncbi:Methyl-accepting chemotaxis protein (MCP) signalling domain-containing protein, partial [Pseudoxanthomonas wuyuanensis]
QEQSAGIEQVNQTITQMDETTQQNAALVEEASAAARAMEEQAGALAATVAIFRLNNGAGMRAAKRAPAAVAAAPAKPARPVAHAAKPAPPRRAEPALAEGGDWQEF